MIKLIDEKTQKAIKLNEVYSDFRGEKWVIESYSKGHHPGSTGRVYAHKPGDESTTGYREFFPGVFGMKIVEE